MTRPLKAFQNLKNFHCIGPDCEDTCCGGWQINLYEDDYHKINNLFQTDPQKAQYQSCIKKNPEDGRLKENYGVLNFNPGKHCSMMDDGWCILHRDHGETMLPTVCATFPRLIFDFEDHSQVNLRLSCPEAARVVLLDETTPSMEPYDTTDLPEIFETNPWPSENPEHYKKHLPRVSAALIKLLTSPNYSSSQKAYFVLYFAKKATPFYHMLVQDDPGTRLERLLKQMDDPKYLMRLVKGYERIQGNEAPIRDIVLGVCNARLQGDHYARFNDLCSTVLMSYLPAEAVRPNGQLSNQDNLAAIWELYLKRRALILQRFGKRIDMYMSNFAINFWHQGLFIGDADLLGPTRKFVIYRPLIGFLLHSHPETIALLNLSEEEALPKLDALVVHVVQVLMKNLDANLELLRSVLSTLDTLKVDNLNAFAAMIKL